MGSLPIDRRTRPLGRLSPYSTPSSAQRLARVRVCLANPSQPASRPPQSPRRTLVCPIIPVHGAGLARVRVCLEGVGRYPSLGTAASTLGRGGPERVLMPEAVQNRLRGSKGRNCCANVACPAYLNRFAWVEVITGCKQVRPIAIKSAQPWRDDRRHTCICGRR